MLDMPTQSTTQALQYLFARATGAIEVCGLGDQGKVVAEHFDTSQIEDAVDWLEDTSERGFRAYFGIQPRQEHLAGNGKRATDADVSQCVAIALDFDDGDALAQANSGLFQVAKPSMVIRTGTAPTNRAWVFWVFEDPETNSDWYGLAKELAHATGADPSATNPSRIGRAPGFYTLPPAKKKERGYINERAVLTYIGERHDADWLRDTLTKWIENAQPRSGQGLERGADPLQRKVGKFSGLKEPLNVEALKQNCLNDMYWNESMFRLVGHWARQGLSDGEIIALSVPYTAPGYSEQQTEAEVEDMIRRTRQRQGIEPVDVDAAPKPLRTEKKTRSRGLTLYRPEEMIYTGPQPMLLEGLIPYQSVGWIVADSNVGKSFLAIGAAVAISAGQPFLGHETRQAFCLYVGLEGKAELRNRFAAAFKGQNIRPQDCHLAFAAGDMALGNAEDLDALAEMFKSARGNDGQPGLLIIDTFSQAIAGEAENDNDAMSMMVKNMTLLSDELNATVLACHHVAKGTLDPRGAGALRGNSDTVILMDKMADEKTINVWTNKQRDGAPCEPFSCEISDVELTSPETGEVGSKGYLRRVERDKKADRKTDEMTKTEYKIFKELVHFSPGSWVKNSHATVGIPAGIWTVKQSEFVNHLVHRGLSPTEQTARRHLSNIIVKGHIQQDGRQIWNTLQEQFEGGNDEHF